LPRIPLIDDLTDNQITPGSNILVEFDPASQWYNASLSIAAGWLRTGGRMGYYAVGKPPDSVRSQLARFGINVEKLEAEESLAIYDLYTCQLGQKSKEKYALESLKVSDLSIWLSGALKRASPDPNLLWIVDSFSPITRFNLISITEGPLMNDDQKKQQEEDYLKWSQEQKRQREQREHEASVEDGIWMGWP
jgi:KaiC/GvpD/RAD55 family RecA-like ATPase